MATKAQKWARERNWNRRRFLGVIATIGNIASDKSTTDLEYEFLQTALSNLIHVKTFWKDANPKSKEAFLAEIKDV